MCNSKEIAVFGNGPGSISTIDQLTKRGHNVTQIYPQDVTSEPRSIYSTSAGIYLDIMHVYCPETYRYPLPSMRIFTMNGTDFSVHTGNEYFMVDYPRLINDWDLRKPENERIHIEQYSTNNLHHMTVREDHTGVEVTIEGGTKRFDAAIDATGAGHHLMQKVHPELSAKDRMIEYVYAGQFPGTLEKDEMILVWEETGGTSWINPSIYTKPNGEPLVDIVYSAWGWESHFPRFLDEADARLAHLVDFAGRIPGVHIRDSQPIGLTAGRIVSDGLYKPTNNNIYAVGESAGVAKPKTGETFNRTLLNGLLTADAIDQNKSPQEVYNQLKQLWPNDYQFLAFTLARLRDQHMGNSGKLMDIMGSWFNNGTVDQSFVKQMEDYMIHGTLQPALLKRFVTNRTFLEMVVHTMLTYARIKVFGLTSFQRNWALPELPQSQSVLET